MAGKQYAGNWCRLPENLQPEIVESDDGIVSQDGNTVDRDKELAEMAENKIMYDASVQLLNKKLALLKYTISSDGR